VRLFNHFFWRGNRATFFGGKIAFIYFDAVVCPLESSVWREKLHINQGSISYHFFGDFDGFSAKKLAIFCLIFCGKNWRYLVNPNL
jgi:hypothetical protein